MEYLSVEEAREKPGLRLVLTAGVPGPWGEAAKAVFHVKGIPYLPVRQDGGMENAALRAWTGRDNAPIAVPDDEPPRDGWADILALAERIAPEPALVPEALSLRAEMFGFTHLVAGPSGFAWERRQMLFAPMLALGENAPEPIRRMAAKYGTNEATTAAAAARVRALLEHWVTRLEAQRAAGSEYLVGDSLTAADLYAAAFAAMIEPLPEAQCPMGDGMRTAYHLTDPAVRVAGDGIILAHRERIYTRHLELPLDF